MNFSNNIIDSLSIDCLIFGFKKGELDIQTTYDTTPAGSIVFTATLTLHTKNGSRIYTGHSFGKAGGDKAFEKLETVAVGRALAFAGYTGEGDIASAEEMENVEPTIDYEKIEKAQLALDEAQTLDELKAIYQKLPKAIKGDKAVIATKDARKTALQNAGTEPGTGE